MDTKVQKDIDGLKRIAEAIIDRIEAVESALGISKSRKADKPAGESLGTTISKALANPTVPGRGSACGATVAKNLGRKGQLP